MKHTLVIATNNKHKVHELSLLFQHLPLEVVAVGERFLGAPTVVEDGLTFEANAEKKARAIAEHTMTMTLADDSGLEVDLLGGAPGVRSARYAGERATDAENNSALLAAVKAATRGAETVATERFRSVLVFLDPFTFGGKPQKAEGACEGHITTEPRGTNGFGYDPLFVVGGTTRTMAEHSEVEKAAISHRGVAARAIVLVLEEAIRQRKAQAAAGNSARPRR